MMRLAAETEARAELRRARAALDRAQEEARRCGAEVERCARALDETEATGRGAGKAVELMRSLAWLQRLRRERDGAMKRRVQAARNLTGAAADYERARARAETALGERQAADEEARRRRHADDRGRTRREETATVDALLGGKPRE